MGSSERGLRRRCPICRKLRGFREPDGSQGGTDHPRRKPWAKVNGVWVCGWCAGTASGSEGPGTVPHGVGGAQAAAWEEVTLPTSPAKMFELRLGSVALFVNTCGNNVNYGSWIMRWNRKLEAQDEQQAQAEVELLAERSLALALREVRAFLKARKR